MTDPSVNPPIRRSGYRVQLLYLPSQQLLDPLFLLRRERTLNTCPQVAQADRSVFRAHEPFDSEAEGRAHAADLALPALGDHDLDLPAIAPNFDSSSALRDGHSVVELDAVHHGVRG